MDTTFNISHKTLSDRINGKLPKNVGRFTYLTESEESLIVELQTMAGDR